VEGVGRQPPPQVTGQVELMLTFSSTSRFYHWLVVVQVTGTTRLFGLFTVANSRGFSPEFP
jgi:hypothetical protein